MKGSHYLLSLLLGALLLCGCGRVMKARLELEKARIEAEKARADAETVKAEAEAASRIAQEEQRKAEQARQKAEQAVRQAAHQEPLSTPPTTSSTRQKPLSLPYPDTGVKSNDPFEGQSGGLVNPVDITPPPSAQPPGAAQVEISDTDDSP